MYSEPKIIEHRTKEFLMANLKKIGRKAFRSLSPNECRILLIRPPECIDELVLTPESKLLEFQGRNLRMAGIKIASAISSPTDPAIASIYFTKVGLEQGGLTITHKYLANMESEIAELTERARQEKTSIEQCLFRLCQVDSAFCRRIIERGTDGVVVLRRFAENFLGQTILACSGFTNIVAIISVFSDNPSKGVHRPHVYIRPGQIVELIYSLMKHRLTEIHYLETTLSQLELNRLSTST